MCASQLIAAVERTEGEGWPEWSCTVLSRHIGLLFAVLFLSGGGTLLIVTSRDPHQNAVTSLVYEIMRSVPRAGLAASISDETWCFLNGVVLLVGAFLMLVLA